jgi:hypothetical protein
MLSIFVLELISARGSEKPFFWNQYIDISKYIEIMFITNKLQLKWQRQQTAGAENANYRTVSY